MKVLHVIGSLAPRDGGPTVAIHGMAPALAALGHEVTIATTNADGPRETLDVPVDSPVRAHGVTYHYFERTVDGSWGLSLPLARWLTLHAGDFDVIEVHGLFVFATIAGCRAARQAGVPYIVRPLGMLDPWSLRQHAWKKQPYVRFIERRHLANAAAIHVTSESEADGVRSLGFGDRVHVIPLGVSAVAPTRQRAASTGDTKLLFLSRLHPKKNLPLLLEALRDARNRGARLTLTVAGSGTAAYRAELERTVKDLGLDDVVRFVGQVQGADKDALLAAADAFVLLSSQENFGIAVAEALAVGLPVVISDQVALAPDVQAEGAGLVVPIDAGAAADALVTIDANPERRLEMGRRATQLVGEKYSWDRTARALADLFTTLVPGAAKLRRTDPVPA